MMEKKVIQRERKVAMPKIKLLLLLAVLVLVSCDGTVYHSFKHVDSKAWSPNDTLSFVYEGADNKYDAESFLKMTAQVRYKSDYKYQNLLMRVETLDFKDSTLLSIDTLCCRIYDDSGRHIGSTAGVLYQNNSSDVIVNVSPADTLLLRLSHIMSDSVLGGICDVGIQLTSQKR